MELNVLKDEIAKGLRAFKAFENAAAVLSELETLEHTKKDMESRVSSSKSELIALKDEAKKANDIISDAKSQAEKFIADAKIKLSEMMTKANENAAIILADTDKKCADKAIELEALVQKCLHAQNDIADIADVKAKLQLDIDALNAIKENARKFLG